MTSESYRPAKLFTVEEANAMLPLIRAITSDLVQQSREVLERHDRLSQLTNGRNLESGDPYTAELLQIQETLEKEAERVKEFVDELRALGAEPKSLTEGLVDFPSMMDGRLVHLCWKLGEDEVMHWHELDAGFDERQPLMAAMASD
ncbi:MAG: DUF2203 domain-containing protein [Planctomycetes bacterium]|nr:DUF2203 domain-containing protein [Planctomycetota bacterium]